MERVLHEHGREGWELVAACDPQPNAGALGLVFSELLTRLISSTE
jgi:hypothetical protein